MRPRGRLARSAPQPGTFCIRLRNKETDKLKFLALVKPLVWHSTLALALCGIGMGLANAQAAKPQTVSKTAPLAWKDVEGRAYSLSRTAGKKATVFFFSSTQCPIANLYTPRMIELAKAYTPRGVQFFLVN